MSAPTQPLSAPPAGATPPRPPVGAELGADHPTGEPRFWLRTCNGIGPGQLVSYVGAHWQAAQDGVTGTLDTELHWSVGSTQDPRHPPRQFTLAPLTDEQARTWLRAHGSARRDGQAWTAQP